ncbi:hypothetical protein I6I85_09390 [Mobiluncus curtisii]|uniref:HTH cro/C1-type domain-containing protein n=2 Tax=Mobiluncus curtisii TaxID=2051 RepID=D6ZGE5_MOBCV|nr:hypothetical protein HMPREF0573_11384 [Mobiluncus curtisii ATCC 43063]QQU08588.1 hypothetical protein I6I85_09265 [Mobiluncus curtisii]QQU08609.1 hypothetical protein I6I85_09390 [Mobiluncus curtisii]SQB64857.1 Uncharacterised protein [Mobiluncus curtisii]
MDLNELITRAVKKHLETRKISQSRLAKSIAYQQSRFNRRMNGQIPWSLRDIERLQDAGVKIPGIAVGHHADSVVIDDPALLCEEG